MRRRRGTKQHSEWSRSRILILAVTFLVSAGLGTFGISAVERMSQLAATNAAGGNDKFCVDKFKDLKDKEKALKAKGQKPAKPPEEEIKTIDCTWSGVGGTVPSKCGPGGQECVGDPSKANKPPKEEPKKDDKKKEEPGGKPETPPLPEKKPKKEPPKDEKCKQDTNAPECKQAQNEWYCSIPGVSSFFSSQCSENVQAGGVPPTSQGGEEAITQALKNFADSPPTTLGLGSESGRVPFGALPGDSGAVAENVAQQGAWARESGPGSARPSSVSQIPSSEGGYTPPLSTFDAPDAGALTQGGSSALGNFFGGFWNGFNGFVNWVRSL